MASGSTDDDAPEEPADRPRGRLERSEVIEVRGAREHNLRGVDLVLPKNQLVVFSGVSGSGKSSLAFDTLYAEGQRRYVESLSSYARQFMGQMAKPDVDYLGGLSPSISIEQKTSGANPRSTVGTVTEIHDYLRVLFARVGRGHCPDCGRPIEAQSREQIIARVLTLPAGPPVLLMAPVVRNQKGEFKDFFQDLIRRGYVRARVDGKVVRLTDELRLERQMRHDIDVVVDRVTLGPNARPRVAEAVEAALKLSDGSVVVVVESEDAAATEMLLSSKYACLACSRSFEPPSPQLFSFNSPLGMCPDCDGLGVRQTFEPDLMVADSSLSVSKGAIAFVGAFKEMGRWRRHIFDGVAKTFSFSLTDPWEKLTDKAKQILLYGSGDTHVTFTWRSRGKTHRHGGLWEGVIPQLTAKYKKTASPMHRAMYERFMRTAPCPSCAGRRLNPQARAVRLAGKTLVELGALPVDELASFFDHDLPESASPVEWTIAGGLAKEIRARLGFLLNVGLNYLTLDRSAPTLSGGEAQRIRLAGQIGSGLVGVLYVLDEPSIGLHPRDNGRLLATLEQLRDQGNTVLVVEHDEDTLRAADYLVDFGPGPGVRGGEVVAQGSVDQVMAEPRSLTGGFLSGRLAIEVPKNRRPVGVPPTRDTVQIAVAAAPPAPKRRRRSSSPMTAELAELLGAAATEPEADAPEEEANRVYNNDDEPPEGFEDDLGDDE
ncbi:MAG: excinuclease ABC subunit UvrA [Planctomycetia bacterium]